jgi:hypothetical protein
MTQRTAGEMYRDLREAGFSRASAIIMVAIGLGESGGNDTALGDVGLEDSTWGPSVGLYQVRTVKGQTGSGSDRDLSALMGDPDRQAQAALDISSKGTDFTPWTVFTSGKYQEYLDQAQAAADTATTSDFVTVGDGVGDLLGGIIPNPVAPNVSAVQGALGSALEGLIPSFRDGAIMLAFAGLGMALVGLGLIRTVAPAVGKGVKTVAGAVT